MFQSNYKNKAFTLVEILIVSAVLLMLMAGYISIQKKMINWKNKIDMESRADVLKKLFEAYYVSSLRDLRNTNVVPNGELYLVPTCDGAATYTRNLSGYTIGRVYICTANGSAISGKNVAIDYSSTLTAARSLLGKLAAVGAGAEMLNPRDPWNRPLIFVVFDPVAANNSYCPTTDNSTPKIVIISLGSDGKLNLPSGYDAVSYLNEIFSADGSFNPNWQPLGDDMVFSISMLHIDLERKRDTINHLAEIATLLKNKFFSDFYKVINNQSLGLDPTKINFFASLFCTYNGSSCDLDSSEAASTLLSSVFGLTTTDEKDFFGNYICVDPDINSNLSSLSGCNNYSGNCYTPEQTNVSGFVARVYSVCSLPIDSRPSCNSVPGDIWPSASIIESDPSLIYSIAGMY